MPTMPEPVRSTSFGEGHQLTVVDRFGTWLSRRAMHAALGDVTGRVLADIGCGHSATFGMSVHDQVAHLVVADVSLDDAVCRAERVTAVLGPLPESLDTIEAGSVDLTVMNSVLEHLDDPVGTLRALRRITEPTRGIVFVNVPSWQGKRALEFSAFRLGTSPRLEIEDHRRYYDKRQLWQELRDAGFLPSQIRVRAHKFGLNLSAVCRPLQRSEGEPT